MCVCVCVCVSVCDINNASATHKTIHIPLRSSTQLCAVSGGLVSLMCFRASSRMTSPVGVGSLQSTFRMRRLLLRAPDFSNSILFLSDSSTSMQPRRPEEMQSFQKEVYPWRQEEGEREEGEEGEGGGRREMSEREREREMREREREREEGKGEGRGGRVMREEEEGGEGRRGRGRRKRLARKCYMRVLVSQACSKIMQLSEIVCAPCSSHTVIPPYL